jgi:hypothetical protein
MLKNIKISITLSKRDANEKYNFQITFKSDYYERGK